jgi:hypothetical protein
MQYIWHAVTASCLLSEGVWRYSCPSILQSMATQPVILHRYSSTFYLTMLLPAIPFMLTLLMTGIAVAWSFLVKRHSMCAVRLKWMCANPQEVHRYLLSWIASAVPFLNVTYNSLCVKAFATFSCFQLRDQTWVLNAAPQVVCWESEEHSAMIVVSVVAIVVYVIGIPLYVSTTMIYAHRRDKLKDPVWLDVFGYMYQQYGAS